MSFLESIQHGLEKASQEAARLTKIQHLHNVINDLTFKTSQQGEKLIAQAMEMYHNGHLGQGELVAICQQIATYQQNINEVHEELERLHQSGESADQPEDASAQPEAKAPARDKVPTQPLVAAAPASPAEPAHKASAPRKHAAAHTESAPDESAPAAAPATGAPGTYAQGVLPPVYSPFVNQPAPAATSAPAEQEKATKAHHSAKKDGTDSASPAPEK